MGTHRRSERPRSEASYGPETGTTYLLHFDRPYISANGKGVAGHYVGWTQDLAARLEAHARGRGARLVEVARNAGIGFRLARTWPESTRDREDLIKHAGGARRYCPECGVKPRDQATPRVPVRDRRPMWMADRDGQWNDGTPIIYDPDQTWKQARAIRAALQIPEPDPAGQAELAALDELQRQWNSQEEQVGLRNAIARGAAAMRDRREAHQRAVADREADRLWAIADELDRQMGRQPGYQHELTAERAARIRARLGEDLVRDARLEAMPRAEGQPLEHWAIGADPVSGYHGTRRLDGEPETPANKQFYDGIESGAAHDAARAAHEPELQGTERDAEIDRLAAMYAEAGEEAEQDAMYEEGEDEAYLTETAGPRANSAVSQGADPEWLQEVGERYQRSGEIPAGWTAAGDPVYPEPDDQAEEPGIDAATWGPGLADAAEDAAVPPGMEAWRGMPAGEIAEERSARMRQQANEPSAAAPDYYRSEPGSAGHRADYAAMHARDGGVGYADPDADVSYGIDNAAELAYERYYDDPEGYYGVAETSDADQPAAEAPGEEPGDDAATWRPALESGAAAEDALHAELGRQPERPAEATQGPDIVADYLRGDLEERATAAEALRRLEARALAREHIAQANHDGASAAAAREQAGAFRQARLHAQAEAYSTAAALQEDAAQADCEPGEFDPGPPAPGEGDLWDREAGRARQHLERWSAEHGPDGGYAESLRHDVARYEQWAGEARASAQPAMERMSPEAASSPEAAPAATTQPAGTPHTDRALAGRGWQADHHGGYVRNPEAEAPGPRSELAGYEADSPDHQYGSPECAEADPEGAHFGRGPGEPMDTGRWPVLQADYGRMFIPPYEPQAEAEAV